MIGTDWIKILKPYSFGLLTYRQNTLGICADRKLSDAATLYTLMIRMKKENKKNESHVRLLTHTDLNREQGAHGLF